MTICISVRVAEGLVLAADSASMLQGSIKGGPTTILQTFEFANKITRILDEKPIGVMSWGIGSISDRSIQSLVMEFAYEYDAPASNPYDVKVVADAFLDFIKQRYESAYPDKKNQPRLGLFVGGYSSGQFFSDQFTYEFPASTDWTVVRPNSADGSLDFGANWYGLTDALTRLIRGFDPSALDELVKRGVDRGVIQKWVNDSVSDLTIVFDGMPLQDAIDFANFAAQVVIGRYRFGIGPPLCGGDVDIAVITPADFQWAQRKQWATTG